MISSSFIPRRILLTGGTGALGHIVTKRLLQAGHRVATTWRVEHEREHLTSELGRLDDQLLFVAADVTDPASVDSAIDEVAAELGGIDALVHLVGSWKGGEEVHEHSFETWKKMIEINLTSSFLCCRAALPWMRKDGWGRIVVDGVEAVRPHHGVVAAARQGQILHPSLLWLPRAAEVDRVIALEIEELVVVVPRQGVVAQRAESALDACQRVGSYIGSAGRGAGRRIGHDSGLGEGVVAQARAAVGTHLFDDVQAFAPVDLVVASPAVQKVVPAAAGDDVVTAHAPEVVVPVVSDQDVVALTPLPRLSTSRTVSVPWAWTTPVVRSPWTPRSWPS